MDLRTALDDARRLYSIREILGMDEKKWAVCPLPMHVHHNNTPSFSVFWRDGHERFRCHGNCGAMGDVIDLIGYMNLPHYDRRDGRQVSRALGLLSSRYEVTVPTPPAPTPPLADWAWREYYPPGPGVLRYAAQRGLHPATLEHFRIGQRGAYMAIPAFAEGRLLGIKFRNIGQRGLRYYSLEGSRASLYNYDAVFLTDQPVLVVNGEIAVMALHQHGFLACCATGGEAAFLDEFRAALSLAAKIVIVADNDPDPQVRAQMEHAYRDRAEALRAQVVYAPAPYKDLDEHLLHNPTETKAQITTWLEN